MGGAMLQHPLSIPEYLGGIVRNGLDIRNQRVREPLVSKFHVFRCPGEGRGRRRHPGMGSGSRREGGAGARGVSAAQHLSCYLLIGRCHAPAATQPGTHAS